MKLDSRRIAVALRKRGYSYREISIRLNVSKSTASLWLRDIPLSTKAKSRLSAKVTVGQQKSYLNKKRARILQTKLILENASKEFKTLIKDPLFLPGLCLYWAEGDKHAGERVKFTNSDPILISFMMKWFRLICGVPEEKFRVALHIHNLHSPPNVKIFWSKLTGIKPTQFNRLYVKKSSLHQRRNVLYNGTCGIVICNKGLFRRILGWKMAFLKHFKLPPLPVVQRIERGTSNP